MIVKTHAATGVRMALIVLLLAHFALGLQFSLRNPLGEAPDEADHWAYVVHLAQTGALPEGPDLTQAKHPPLFHIGASLLARLGEPSIDFFHPNPAVNLAPGPAYSPNFFLHDAETPPWSGAILAYHLARIWSLLLTTLTVAATAALARAAFPLWQWLLVAAASAVAFLPEFLFLGGALSNDTAAAFCGAWALWGAMALYRSGGDLRRGWWTPLALGLGVLAKVSSVALWPVAGLALLLGVWQEASSSRTARWRRLVTGGLLLFVPALAIVAPWLWRNLQLYGDLMGMNMALKTIDQRLTPWTWADTQWLLRGWFFSYWGKFGGAGHIAMSAWIYWLLGGLMLLALTGGVRWWWRGDWQRVRVPLILLLLAPLIVAISMWQYSLVALGTDQGRLLFPAVAALQTLLAGGVLAWLPARAHPAASLALGAALAGISLFALWGVLLPAFAA